MLEPPPVHLMIRPPIALLSSTWEATGPFGAGFGPAEKAGEMASFEARTVPHSGRNPRRGATIPAPQWPRSRRRKPSILAEAETIASGLVPRPDRQRRGIGRWL